MDISPFFHISKYRSNPNFIILSRLSQISIYIDGKKGSIQDFAPICCPHHMVYLKVFNVLSLSFDTDIFLLFYCRFYFFLRDKEFQDTMLKLSLDIFFRDIFTYIITSLAGSCVTFTTDVLTSFFLLLILIQSFGSADCQISVIQFCCNFIFLESRKIDLQFITIFFLIPS